MDDQQSLSPAPGRAARALAAAGFAGGVAAAAALGRSSRRVSRRPWYRALEKPPFQPPAWAFGPVWTVLYAALATSGYRVWRRPGPGRGRALGWWGAQLVLNAAWTPLFFGARRPRAALVDAALLAPAAAAYARAAGRVDRTAGWLVAPYVAWTAFALALNASLVRRNPRLAR